MVKFLIAGAIKPTDSIFRIEKDIAEWEQPNGASAYSIGDKVLFEGSVYESLIDNNVWSPVDYPAGWSEIIEE